LGIKYRLPDDGDWLFPTFSRRCKTCKESVQGDLADAFSEAGSAVSAFGAIPPDADSTKILVEHAHTCKARVKEIADLQHDKAKALLGTSSFSAAMWLAAVALMEKDYAHFSNAAMVLQIGFFLLASSHLYRSLREAIKAITRNEAEEVPTQTYVEILSQRRPEEQDLDGTLRKLAAETIAAANRTHALYLPRIEQVQRGQISFRYSLVFLGLMLAVHLIGRLWTPAVGDQERGAATECHCTTSVVQDRFSVGCGRAAESLLIGMASLFRSAAQPVASPTVWRGAAATLPSEHVPSERDGQGEVEQRNETGGALEK